MPSDFENGARKTIDISFKAEKITADVLKTAVCVSMKSVTVSPSRPQLDCQANGKAPQHRPSLRS